MEKLKILVIAPYNGLKDLINDVANERNDIEIHTIVADMLDGLEIAKSIQENGFHAIISRAGTADLIREIAKVPVIDVNISILDMMRAIKIAQNYSGKFAIVGFKSITEKASIICEINKLNIEMKTLSNLTEIKKCLLDLKNRGVSLIVGDVVTTSYAKNLGLHTILITTGRESVLSAFEGIDQLNKILLERDQKSLLMVRILENSNISVICFNNKKKIIYSSINENIGEYNKVLEKIECLYDVLLKEKEIKELLKLGNNIVVIRGKILEFKEGFYYTFYIDKQNVTAKTLEKAIKFINVSECQQINFDTFTTSSNLFKCTLENAKTYSVTKSPVIILGEQGSGKDTLAYAIYEHSNLRKNPFVIIDSKYMDEKKWTHLFGSEDSFFTNLDFTFYIKNLHFMDEKSQRGFESYIINSYLHKRNRFIFSCIPGYSKSFDGGSLLYFIKNKLAAFPLTVPNLNQRKEDIPSLVSLFLSDLSLKYGKQVIGLDNDAMKILQDFNWINNIDQLLRVVEQLTILSESYYINSTTVREVLSFEILPQYKSKNFALDLNRTLDDIDKDIINIVLSEENFNQSKAAHRLGISRSTLWRKIK